MTDPAIKSILDTVRPLLIKVGNALTTDKRLFVSIHINGAGEFVTELTPTQAMELASHIVMPVLDALHDGTLTQQDME